MEIKDSFQVYLKKEIDKVKGTYYPVHAGFLKRAFIKWTKHRKLHPNPNDEFCLPEVGPSYGIISRYEEEYRQVRDSPGDIAFIKDGVREPLEVEKTRPEGYMILNGHHRWAAAYRAGVDKMPIHIIDMTQEKDIRKMLRNSRNRRRAVLDLDEVVLRPEDDPCLEKPLPFPINRIYRERIRLGVPALFHTLRQQGWDVWVYTARICSLGYIKHLLLHYHTPVTGIVTGTARKGPPGSDTMKEMEELLKTKYDAMMHIDGSMVLCTYTGSRRYEQYPLSGSPRTWSREVMEIIEKRKRHEQN